MNQPSNFQPNWVSVPGNTINDILKQKNISFENFANIINKDINYIRKLILGDVLITPELAKKLEDNLGATSNFWLKRESQYRESINRLTSHEEEKWLKELPVREMKKLGWISDIKYSANNFFAFFDVSDIWAWKSKYRDLVKSTSFRSSYTFDSNFLSVCTWLRKGEIESNKIECKKFDPILFKQQLFEIKKLIKRKHPKDFINELKVLCAECGVAVSLVPTPKGCTASGATRAMDNDRIMLLLSFRYLSDDHFWFTFFHEAGHILLHDKGNLFIEEDGHDGLDSVEEKEANNFSSNMLIPNNEREKLKNIPLTKVGIVKFAVTNGISPGIVVGQLSMVKVLASLP